MHFQDDELLWNLSAMHIIINSIINIIRRNNLSNSISGEQLQGY